VGLDELPARRRRAGGRDLARLIESAGRQAFGRVVATGYGFRHGRAVDRGGAGAGWALAGTDGDEPAAAAALYV
jgi:hypothetical protein